MKVQITFPERKKYLAPFLESVVEKAPKEASFRKIYINICIIISKRLAEPPKGWSAAQKENSVLLKMPEWEELDLLKSYLSTISTDISIDYINKMFWFVFYTHMTELCKTIQYKILINDFIADHGLEPGTVDMLKKSFWRYRKGLVSKKTMELADFL